ncbi:hypothetical protein VTH06DRAFT_6026 [Thermothelomyces fergusii]
MMVVAYLHPWEVSRLRVFLLYLNGSRVIFVALVIFALDQLYHAGLCGKVSAGFLPTPTTLSFVVIKLNQSMG